MPNLAHRNMFTKPARCGLRGCTLPPSNADKSNKPTQNHENILALFIQKYRWNEFHSGAAAAPAPSRAAAPQAMKFAPANEIHQN